MEICSCNKGLRCPEKMSSLGGPTIKKIHLNTEPFEISISKSLVLKSLQYSNGQYSDPQSQCIHFVCIHFVPATFYCQQLTLTALSILGPLVSAKKNYN